jgi:plastocyanin
MATGRYKERVLAADASIPILVRLGIRILASAPVRTDTVELPKSYRFEPEAIEVDAGITVTWVNEDDFPHNVHLLDGGDRTEPLPVGGSTEITFEEAGTIDYECSLHPQQMQGTVLVR